MHIAGDSCGTRLTACPSTLLLLLLLQELTRVGVLNVPAWYDAGKVYYESADAIPFASLLMVQLFLFNFVGAQLPPPRLPLLVWWRGWLCAHARAACAGGAISQRAD